METSSSSSFDPRQYVKLGWTKKIKERAKAILTFMRNRTYSYTSWRYVAENYDENQTKVDVSVKNILEDLCSLTQEASNRSLCNIHLKKLGKHKSAKYFLEFNNSSCLDSVFSIIDSIPAKERKEYQRRANKEIAEEDIETEKPSSNELLKPCGANEILVRDMKTGLYGLALKQNKMVIVEPNKTLIELFSNYEEIRKIGYLENLEKI